jgi:hypothetical protein
MNEFMKNNNVKPSLSGVGDFVGQNKAGRDIIQGDQIGRDKIQGNQTKIKNTGDGVIIGDGNTVSGGININKNNLNSIDPQFKDSIIEFENLLNIKLKEFKIPTEQKKSLQENIEKLSKDVKDVKPDEVIKNEDKVDEIKATQISLAEKIVSILPTAAESIAAVTPLAPFSKAIGKGTGYFAEWIMKKLNQAR